MILGRPSRGGLFATELGVIVPSTRPAQPVQAPADLALCTTLELLAIEIVAVVLSGLTLEAVASWSITRP